MVTFVTVLVKRFVAACIARRREYRGTCRGSASVLHRIHVIVNGGVR